MQLNLSAQPAQIIRARDIKVPEHMKVRLSTGLDWFDQALGSPEKPGFIAGSVILVSAAPGGGKSTLLRQMCGLSKTNFLYNVGEEGFEQVKLALDERKFGDDFDLANYTDVDELIVSLKEGAYKGAVIDSVQNLYSRTDHRGQEVKQGAGSNRQLCLVTEKLYAFAKESLVTLFLVCHSTKSGDFKGPQQLEHTIDVSMKISVSQETVDADSGEEDSEEDDGMAPDKGAVQQIVTRRILVMEKNRFGLTMVDYHLNMTAHGLALTSAPAEEKVVEAPKKEKGRIRSIATKLLAEYPNFTRKEFIAELMDAADCSPFTAQAYWQSK